MKCDNKQPFDMTTSHPIITKLSLNNSHSNKMNTTNNGSLLKILKTFFYQYFPKVKNCGTEDFSNIIIDMPQESKSSFFYGSCEFIAADIVKHPRWWFDHAITPLLLWQFKGPIVFFNSHITAYSWFKSKHM